MLLGVGLSGPYFLVQSDRVISGHNRQALCTHPNGVCEVVASGCACIRRVWGAVGPGGMVSGFGWAGRGVGAPVESAVCDLHEPDYELV